MENNKENGNTQQNSEQPKKKSIVKTIFKYGLIAAGVAGIYWFGKTCEKEGSFGKGLKKIGSGIKSGAGRLCGSNKEEIAAAEQVEQPEVSVEVNETTFEATARPESKPQWVNKDRSNWKNNNNFRRENKENNVQRFN